MTDGDSTTLLWICDTYSTSQRGLDFTLSLLRTGSTSCLDNTSGKTSAEPVTYAECVAVSPVLDPWWLGAERKDSSNGQETEIMTYHSKCG